MQTVSTYVGRIPTNKWNAKAGPSLQLVGVELVQPEAYEVGVEVDAPDVDAAYEVIVGALRDAGIELNADDFTMPLYRIGPGKILLGPDA